MNFTQRLANVHPVLMREGRGYLGSDSKRLCEADVEDLVSQVCEELLIKEARGSGYDSVYEISPEQYILAYFRRRAAERFKVKQVEYVSAMPGFDSNREQSSSYETAYKNASYTDDYCLSSAVEIINDCRELCADAGIEFKLLVACAERMKESDLSALGGLFAPLRAYAKKHSDVFEIIEDFLDLFSMPDFNMNKYLGVTIA